MPKWLLPPSIAKRSRAQRQVGCVGRRAARTAGGNDGVLGNLIPTARYVCWWTTAKVLAGLRVISAFSCRASCETICNLQRNSTRSAAATGRHAPSAQRQSRLSTTVWLRCTVFGRCAPALDFQHLSWVSVC